MLTRPVACSLLLLLLTAPAVAQEAKTYDIARLLNAERTLVGVAIVETQDETEDNRSVVMRDGQVVQNKAQAVGFKAVRERTAQTRDRAGRATRTLLVYRSFTDRKAGALDVAGLRVEVTGVGPEARIAPLGGRAIPAPLLRALREEFLGDSADEPGPETMFVRPVKVGERWKIPLANVARLMKMPADAVDAKASSASGVLTRVRAVDGAAALDFAVKAELFIVKMKGERLDAPMTVTLEIAGTLPTDPQRAASRGRMTFKARIDGEFTPPGAPASVKVAMDMTARKQMERRPR